MPENATTGTRGRCWQCGYRLDGIPSRRCPECGKAFDPDDPRSMNMSGSRNPIARWFIRRPPGAVSLGAAALATAAILLTAGLPVTLPDFSFPDVRLFIAEHTWRDMWRHADRVPWRDSVFIVAVELWLVLLLTVGLRAAVRGILAKWYEPEMVRASRRVIGAFFALLLLALVLLPLGVTHRLAADWVGRAELARPATGTWSSIPNSLATVSPQREDEILRYAMRWLSPRDRMAAAGIVVETRTTRGLPLLEEACAHERNASVRAGLLLLIGMYRKAETAPLFAAAMDDAQAEVRAAGEDALGILHAPPYPIPADRYGSGGNEPLYVPPVDGRPGMKIDLSELIDYSIAGIAPRPSRNSTDHLADAPIVLPDDYRQKLEHMMLAPGTPAEHAAAARALLRWPPADYTLRVAEWGVWINDGGQFKLVQSVLDEIPPHVHRLGNKKAELMDRVNQIMIITKPIVHIRANHPMAIDIGTEISGGQPWFAYPRPDDLTITARDFGSMIWDTNPDGTPKLDANGNRIYKPRGPTLDKTDPPANFTRLDGRQGYPAMEPAHPRSGSIGGGMGSRNDIASAGVRWQSLIVTPDLPAWAKLAALPPDPKFAWWNRLRRVNASYVISQDEAERFLYYDGPTDLPAPIDATLTGNTLTLKTTGLPPGWQVGWGGEKLDNGMTQTNQWSRAALFVRVRGGKAAAAAIPPGMLETAATFTVPPALTGDGPAMLLEKLTDAGLTKDEAQGLIDVWTPQFFQTDGDRLLVLLSSRDYDTLCPLRMQPKPTMLVRTGILLKELGKP